MNNTLATSAEELSKTNKTTLKNSSKEVMTLLQDAQKDFLICLFLMNDALK
jgi:hypothetical protein